MDNEYNVKTLSFKHSEIKEVAGESYKLMQNNYSKHKSNKTIEFLKNKKYWLASLFSRFKSYRECMRIDGKKNIVKNIMTQ